MDLYSQPCSSSQLSLHSSVANTLMDTARKLVSPILFIPAMRIGTIDYCHLIPLSVTSTLAGGSQGQRRAKPVGFIFSHTSQVNGMKFGDVMKQLEFNVLILMLSEIFCNKGK